LAKMQPNPDDRSDCGAASGAGARANRAGAQRLDDLFREYSGKIYGLALRLGLDRQEAEDGVQEVFLKVQRRIGTFRGEAALSTWLYRVAINTLRDHRRKTVRQTRPVSFSLLASGRPDDGDGSASPSGPDFEDERRDAQSAEMAEVHERSILVRAAMNQLSPKFREALVLRELEGMTYRDIARVLDVAQGTVESRIHRGRVKLAQILKSIQEAL
jgi:RNA polymerase sigma-70 factor (ECF subfamily)